MTPDEAGDLIGTTGLVVHPSKGVQGPPGGWKVLGFKVAGDDPLRVESLTLESVAWTETRTIEGPVKDPLGGTMIGILDTIAPHPVEVRPACNPAHFKPNSQAPARVAVPAVKPPAVAAK